MLPRPLPRFAKPAEDGAQLQPAAVVLILAPFAIAIAVGLYVSYAEYKESGLPLFSLAGACPALVLPIAGLLRAGPALLAGMRRRLDPARAKSAAYWLTRIGAWNLGYIPIWGISLYFIAGFARVSVPYGPYGLIAWVGAAFGISSMVEGRFFEKIATALAQALEPTPPVNQEDS